MSFRYTYTNVHRYLWFIGAYVYMYVHIYTDTYMYIWPSSHTIMHEWEDFSTQTWHTFFLLFLNTRQEIPCSGRAEHAYQRHPTPFVPLLVTSVWLDWLKTNQPSDLAHWPALLPVGTKDLFMVTAITAYINWPSESDLLALPLSESIRKSSGSAWLA